jgi:hypothetical protein
MRARGVLAVGVLVLGTAAACQAILGLDEGMPREPDASFDAPPPPIDARPDAEDGVYHRLDEKSFWSSFDLAAARAAIAGGYAGGAFDGRYVYFVPYGNGASGLVTRFDTTGAFTSAAAWSTFELLGLNANAAGYFGGAFAKGSVYLAPYYRQYDAAAAAINGTVGAFNTAGALDAASAWSFFDTKTALGSPSGFNGNGFDGRFVYFAPFVDGTGFHGKVARYDTQVPLDASTSWTSFDVSTVAANAKGFIGTIFDGRYVYFIPHASASGVYNGTTARFDTLGTFISSASWQTFDITSLNVNARGFFGGAFDGRYVYYVPALNDIDNAIVARFDTTAAGLKTASAWQLFSLASVSPNARSFYGAAFDGRYVYLVPNGASGALVTRYDTRAPFSEATSWSTFDLAAVDAGSRGFRGAVFDGRYVYFVPMSGSVVMRFDAREPAAMPSGYSGSFL